MKFKWCVDNVDVFKWHNVFLIIPKYIDGYYHWLTTAQCKYENCRQGIHKDYRII